MADFEKRNQDQIPLGIEVIGFDGTPLGYVREAHEHFLLVGTDSTHEDLEVPVQSVIGIADGKLRVHVTRGSSSPVDDEESAHRLDEI
ncbi:MAG TPA: hypothetical protein VFP05_08610 [Thermomicrobiales bacterium]|jgi:hypothetical protein|nr:hypothetical protein [Thermomicrobiales bacterium]